MLARISRTPSAARTAATTRRAVPFAQLGVTGALHGASGGEVARACVAFAPNYATIRRADPLAVGGLTRSFATAKATATRQTWHSRERSGKSQHVASAKKSGQSDSSNWRKAYEEFDRLLHIHGNEAKVTPADVEAVVKACVENGRHREAQTVVRKAQSIGISLTPVTSAHLCAVHARKGNVETAFETLTTALASSKKNGAAPDSRLFDPLLSALKDQHDWQSIRRVVQLMHDFQVDPPVRVFRVLMIAAAKSRKKDIVLKTADFLEAKFKDDPMDLATLTAMCQALTEIGETRAVLDKYHLMDQSWLNTHGNTILFNNFVLAALRRGRLNKAVEIFERMKVSESFPPDDFTFATCILEFEKRGEWDQVIRFFNEVQDREIKGISHEHAVNALSCAAVVRALHSREGASKREIERGMRVVLQRLGRVEVKHFGHTASLVDVLEENGYRTQAQMLFERMVEKSLFKAPWLRQDGYEVDLHTFSRGVAKCAVVHAFQQVRANAAVKKADDMRIITGVGKRSKEFLQPVVGDDISQLLVRSFRPIIRPMQHPTNPGILLIRSKLIREWLEEGGVIRHFE